MKKLMLLIIVHFIFINAYAQMDTSLWVTDGQVNQVERDGNNIYWTGDFTYAGPVLGGMVPVNYNTHEVIPGFPVLNGYVYKIINAPNGGWYVAGLFDIPKYPGYKNFIHIKNDFSVDTSVHITPDTSVTDMIISGNRIYLGGTFKFISGISRNYIAALDLNTAALLPWNPNFTAGASFLITRLQKRNEFIYAGGKFSNIGGLVRNNLVEIDTVTGVATTWNPNPAGYVFALAIDSNYLYFGGSFTSIPGGNHNPIAQVDLNTHTYSSFNPGVVGSMPFDAIYDIEISGDYLYVSGNFDYIFPAAGPAIAKLKKNGTTIPAWKAKCKWVIYDLEIDNGNIYFSSISDSFPNLKNYNQYNFFVVDTATGTLQSTDIKMSGRMNTIHRTNDTLFIAGTFTSLSGPTGPGVNRRGLFGYDANTRMPLPVSVDMNGGIYHSKIIDHHMLISGSFDTIATQYRKYFAKIDLATGLADAWYPVFAPTANTTFFLNKDNIYMTGGFTSVDSIPQSCIAVFDTVNFQLKPHSLIFNSTFSNPVVKDLDFTGDRIYITGNFDTLNNQVRHKVACLNTSDSSITPFSISNFTSGFLFGAILNNDRIYCYGSYSIIGDSTRQNIASFDTATGVTTPWKINYPFAGGTVYDVAMVNDSVLISGDNRLYNGAPYSEPLLLADTSMGNFRIWNISGLSSSQSGNLDIQNNILYVTGAIERMDGQYRNNIASWILGPDSTLSVKENFPSAKLNEIAFFPNPAHSSIKVINSDQFSFPLYIQIFDITGSIRNTVKIISRMENIPLINMSSGMYFINCVDNLGRRFMGRIAVSI